MKKFLILAVAVAGASLFAVGSAQAGYPRGGYHYTPPSYYPVPAYQPVIIPGQYGRGMPTRQINRGYQGYHGHHMHHGQRMNRFNRGPSFGISTPNFGIYIR